MIEAESEGDRVLDYVTTALNRVLRAVDVVGTWDDAGEMRQHLNGARSHLITVFDELRAEALRWGGQDRAS